MDTRDPGPQAAKDDSLQKVDVFTVLIEGRGGRGVRERYKPEVGERQYEIIAKSGDIAYGTCRNKILCRLPSGFCRVGMNAIGISHLRRIV